MSEDPGLSLLMDDILREQADAKDGVAPELLDPRLAPDPKAARGPAPLNDPLTDMLLEDIIAEQKKDREQVALRSSDAARANANDLLESKKLADRHKVPVADVQMGIDTFRGMSFLDDTRAFAGRNSYKTLLDSDLAPLVAKNPEAIDRLYKIAEPPMKKTGVAWFDYVEPWLDSFDVGIPTSGSMSKMLAGPLSKTMVPDFGSIPDQASTDLTAIRDALKSGTHQIAGSWVGLKKAYGWADSNDLAEYEYNRRHRPRPTLAEGTYVSPLARAAAVTAEQGPLMLSTIAGGATAAVPAFAAGVAIGSAGGPLGAVGTGLAFAAPAFIGAMTTVGVMASTAALQERADDAYEQILRENPNADIDREWVQAAVVVGGALVGLMETYGTRLTTKILGLDDFLEAVLKKDMKRALLNQDARAWISRQGKRIRDTSAVEGMEEGGQTSVEIASLAFAGLDDRSGVARWEEILNSAAIGAVAGGGFGVVGAPLSYASDRFVSAARTKAAHKLATELVKQSKTSPLSDLKEGDPGRMVKFLQSMLSENGRSPNFYVRAQEFQELLQRKGAEDPEFVQNLRQSMPVMFSELDLAVPLDADVMIPAGEYVTFLGDLHDEIGGMIRARPDAMSVFELDEHWAAVAKDVEAQIDKYITDAVGAEKLETLPGETVEEKFHALVIERLMETGGVGRRGAEAGARLLIGHTVALVSLGRPGAFDTIEQVLRFSGPASDPQNSLMGARVADIDLALDEVRAGERNPGGDTPFRAQVRDQLRALIDQLGLDPSAMTNEQLRERLGLTEQVDPDAQTELLQARRKKKDAPVLSEEARVALGEEAAAQLGERMTALVGDFPRLVELLPYLDGAERAKVKAQMVDEMVAVFDHLDKEQMASVAFAGRGKRGWYAQSAKTIVTIFGLADAPRFAALLAAMSPQTSVEANLYNSVNMWANWLREGRPTDEASIRRLLGESVQGTGTEASVMEAWTNNAIRALQSADPMSLTISGPKVNSFMLNLREFVNQVTLDAWMARYGAVRPELFAGTGMNVDETEPGKGKGYLGYSAAVRKAAEILTERTGELWTPAEIQETVWSFAKVLYEAAYKPGKGIPTSTASDILASGQLTHESIGSAPDFATLLAEATITKILQGAGYDTGSAQEGSRESGGRIEPRGSVLDAEGSGIDADTFREHLAAAAERIDRVESDTERDRVANQAVTEARENLRGLGLLTRTNRITLPGDGKQRVRLGNLQQGTKTSPEAFRAIFRALGIESTPGQDTNSDMKVYDFAGVFGTTVEEADAKLREWLERIGWTYAIFGPKTDTRATYYPDFNDPATPTYTSEQPTAWIFDPSLDEGSFMDHAYTLAWRVTHEVAHGLVNERLTEKYGSRGRRAGAMGHEAKGPYFKGGTPLTLADALRAVEWEHETFILQRQILRDEFGIEITDEQFQKENAINLAGAVARAVTGQFTDPGDLGIHPAALDPDALLKRAFDLITQISFETNGDMSPTHNDHSSAFFGSDARYPNTENRKVLKSYQRKRKKPKEKPKLTELKQRASFYSALTRTLQSSQQRKMTATQLLAMLSKSGVKAEEMDWTLGFREFLAEQGDAAFSLDDLQAALVAVETKVDVFPTEVVLSDEQRQRILRGANESIRADYDVTIPDEDNAVDLVVEFMAHNQGGPRWGIRDTALDLYKSTHNTREEAESRLREIVGTGGTRWVVRSGWGQREEVSDRFATREEAEAALDTFVEEKLSALAGMPDQKFMDEVLDQYGTDLIPSDVEAPIEAGFQNYVLPGAYTDYTERIITVPTPTEMRTIQQQPGSTFRVNEEGFRRYVIQARYGNRTDWVRASRTYATREEAEQELPLDKPARHVTAMLPVRERWEEGHWADQGVQDDVAHNRLTTRETADGKNVVVMEEVQSDHHQAGRDRGYGELSREEYERIRAEGSALEKAAEEEGRAIEKALDAGEEVSQARRVALRKMWKGVKSLKMRLEPVPDAPFKNTWHALVLKDALLYAVEQGAAGLAWTTGRQQVERYSAEMRRVVDEITWAPAPGTETKVFGTKDGSEVFGLLISADGQVLSRIASAPQGWQQAAFAGAGDEVVGEPLSDVLGDKMADEIMAADEGTIGGENGIVVGGKFFETLYDQKLVQEAKKLGKKYGAKVGEVTLGGAGTLHYLPITDAMREAIQSEGLPLFQRGAASTMGADTLASIRFSASALLNEEVLIRLSEASNFSSLPHELFHFFFISLWHHATQPNAHPRLVADLAATMNTFGITHPDQLTEEHYETWARSGEAYLRDGVAPSEELAKTFETYATFLTEIYPDISDIARANGHPLKPELNQIFDRLLATQEQIEKAENNPAHRRHLPVMVAALDDPEEYAAMEEAHAHMKDRQAKKTRAKLLGQLEREKTDAYRRRLGVQRKQAEADINAQPVYRLQHWLQHGTDLATGERVTPEGEPHRLDIERIREMTGETWLGRSKGKKWILKRGGNGLVQENGLDPDMVADVYGFQTVEKMLEALAGAGNRKQKIALLAERRMKRIEGDILAEGSLGEYFEDAIDPDAKGNWLATELTVLARRAGVKGTPQFIARQMAERVAARRAIVDLRPKMFRKAEERAAREIIEAVKREQWGVAHEAAMRQLMNHFLASEAEKLVKRNTTGHNYLTRIGKKASQERIAKYGRQVTSAQSIANPNRTPDVDPEAQAAAFEGKDWLAQINDILERFDLRKSTRVRDARSAVPSLREFMEEQKAGLDENEPGPAFAIDAWLVDTRDPAPWQSLTSEQFDAVVRAVKNLEFLAKEQGLITALGDKQSLDTVGQMLSATVREWAPRTKPPTLDINHPKYAHIYKTDAKQAPYRKMANYSWEFDGLEFGPWFDFFVLPAQRANNFEHELMNEYGKLLSEIFAPMLTLKERARQGPSKFLRGRMLPPSKELHTIPNAETLDPMSQEMVRLFLLNLGNETNESRMREGDGVTTQDINAVKAYASQEDYEFVESVWRLYDTLWPRVAALHARMTGETPERVKPKQVVTPFGTLSGGYHPIKVDNARGGWTLFDGSAEQKETTLQRAGSFAGAMTGHGHRESRSASMKIAKPLRYDFGVITEHFTEVIHDLAWAEWVGDANKILRVDDVARAIKEGYGPASYQQLRRTITRIAQGDPPPRNRIEAFFGKVKNNMTLAFLGMQASTGLLQVYGITNTIERQGPAKVWKYGLKWTNDSQEGMLDYFAWAEAKSQVLAGRWSRKRNTLDRDVRDLRKALVDGGITQGRLPSWQLMPLVWGQMPVDMITWASEYNYQMELGTDESRAIEMADRIVEDTQGGGDMMNLSEVQTGTANDKMWSMFFTFFGALNSLEFESRARMRHGGGASNPGALSRRTLSTVLLYAIPAAAQDLIIGAARGALFPDDDEWEKTLAESFIWSPAMMYLSRTISGRIIASLLEGYDAPGAPPPVVVAMQAQRLISELMQGEADVGLATAASTMVGLGTGLPSQALNKVIRGHEFFTEEQDASPFVYLLGPPYKGKAKQTPFSWAWDNVVK